MKRIAFVVALSLASAGELSAQSTPAPSSPSSAAVPPVQVDVASQGQTPGAKGSSPPGSSVQFDTQGVEFGPWIRRFIAQIQRNWFVPAAAKTQKGITVVTYVVSKDGAIRNVKVTQPSGVAEFDRSAYNAILSANPLEPLPPAYPRDEMAMTLSFYYNERPPAK